MSFIKDAGTRDELEPGPIVKVSSIYAPSAMFMMIDEQWDYHCAGNYKDGGVQPLNMTWEGADSIHGLIFDMMGSYHGNKSNAANTPGRDTLDSAKGSVACYDGHAELYQDPLPYRTSADGTTNLVALFVKYWGSNPQCIMKIADPLLSQCYAQRGIGFTTEQMGELLARVFN